MAALRRILIIIALILLVSLAAAADLSPSTITSSAPGWLVANGVDQATITVHVLDGTPPSSVAGATVTFSLAEGSQDLGTLSVLSATTGTDGVATTIFRTSTRSGTATINALITYNDGTITTFPLSYYQRIDHDIPWYAAAEYPVEAPAGSIIPLRIQFTDNSGSANRVDNKNPAEIHTISLQMSGDGGSGFEQGIEYLQEIAVPTDAEGNISVNLRLSTLTGPNTIQIRPIGAYEGDLVTINGISDSNPCYLIQVPPTPSTFPADGAPAHQFIFYWTVLDKYHNPIENIDLYVTSSKAGEEVHLTTNLDGMASTPYGPKDIAGIYTITARPVFSGTTTPLNATILCTDNGGIGSCSQSVEYTPLDPVDLILTASPQTMVSKDVAGAQDITVRARVVDISGNAVSGQTVTFTKSADTFSPFTETVQSSLTPPATVTTDAGTGYATVQFVPATFAIEGETGYNEAATGTCKVTASWTNPITGEIKTREVTFVWKNYPFLTIESEIDNPDPKVGDIINIRIRVNGNGAALQPKPIDVVLCNDRSGSMLEDYPDRMVVAKDAGLSFASNLAADKDRIGIVSFGDNDARNGWAKLAPTKPGYYWDWSNVYSSWSWASYDDLRECGSNCYTGSWSYSVTAAHQQYLNAHYNNGNPRNYGDETYASNDLGLNYHTTAEVNTALNGIVPGGGTPMREGLYNAVSMFPEYSTERPIRAIILLTDGEWNTGGDPEGIDSSSYSIKSLPGVGTGSIIAWAQSKDIKIFTIGLGSDANSAELTRYATDTGGSYYSASNPSSLETIYEDIAGKLNEEAGGNTQLSADFGSLVVDGNLVTGDEAGEYLEYVHSPGGGDRSSTYITKYSSQPAIPPKNDYYTLIRDDTGNWTNPTLIPGLTSKKLEFDVGRIILNDIWMTNIQFRLKKAGQIEFFGASSPVTFIDSITGTTQTVAVPSQIAYIHSSLVDNPFAALVSLQVLNVMITPSTSSPHLWTVSWDTQYDGDRVVHQKLLYCSETGSDPVSCAVPHTLWPVYPDRPADKGKGTTSDSLVIDTSTWKPGATYKITVWAESYGEKENWGEASHAKDDGSQRTYIRLE